MYISLNMGQMLELQFNQSTSRLTIVVRTLCPSDIGMHIIAVASCSCSSVRGGHTDRIKRMHFMHITLTIRIGRMLVLICSF